MSSQSISQEAIQKGSRVLETPTVEPKASAEHFISRLAFETDPSDVYSDISNKVQAILVIDARTPEAYVRSYIPGAVNLPHRSIDSFSTSMIPSDKILVTYCDGVFCNASTKAAAKLAKLGFRVKVMLDGISGWKKEGYPLEETNLSLGKQEEE